MSNTFEVLNLAPVLISCSFIRCSQKSKKVIYGNSKTSHTIYRVDATLSKCKEYSKAGFVPPGTLGIRVRKGGVEKHNTRKVRNRRVVVTGFEPKSSGSLRDCEPVTDQIHPNDDQTGICAMALVIYKVWA